MEMFSPSLGADEIARHQRLIVFASLVKRDPSTLTEQEFADLEVEFADKKPALAVAQANSWRQAGELRVLFDRVLQVMAGKAETTPLYAYHPDHYGSVAEGLRAQLADLEEDHYSSRWNDLEWITNTFVPLCAAAGKNGYEMLWQPKTISKTRLIVDYMRTPLANAGITRKTIAASAASEIPLPVPAEIAERIDSMVTDAVDPLMLYRKFKEKHGSQGHSAGARPRLKAYHFNMSRGGATLIFWNGEPDRIHLEQAVNAHFQFGTKAEIEQLINALPARRQTAIRRDMAKPIRHDPAALARSLNPKTRVHKARK